VPARRDRDVHDLMHAEGSSVGKTAGVVPCPAWWHLKGTGPHGLTVCIAPHRQIADFGRPKSTGRVAVATLALVSRTHRSKRGVTRIREPIGIGTRQDEVTSATFVYQILISAALDGRYFVLLAARFSCEAGALEPTMLDRRRAKCSDHSSG
jgi:hypothetical protein